MRERKKGTPQILENKLTHAHYHHAIGTRPYLNQPGIEANASVEVPKLHNIKLLIASFYMYTIDFTACKIQNHRETQRVGNQWQIQDK